MKRIFFQTSESCQGFTIDEKSFIVNTLNKYRIGNLNWKTTDQKHESDWIIGLETQRFIDRISNVKGHSASYRNIIPKLTIFALEEWIEMPEPIGLFDSLYYYRKFLLFLECNRAFGLQCKVFRSGNTTSIDNRFNIKNSDYHSLL